jgi:glycosyltransferase 2 family protein
LSRPRVSTLLRVAFAVIVTAYLVWKADPGRVAAELRGLSWTWIAGACALVLVDRTLMAYRWIALLAPLDAGRRPPLANLMRIFFVSTFLGTFMLQSIGADAVRTWSLARDGVPAAQSFASVLMDRLLGVLAIVIAASVGILMAAQVFGDTWIQLAFAVAVAGCAGGAAVVFSPRLDEWLRRAIVARLSGRVKRIADSVLSAIRAYDTHRRTLATVLLASVAVQVLRILQAWMLGRALGLLLPVGPYFIYVPIILLLMLLPITISGLGVAQYGFVTLFDRVAVPEPEAIALSILFIALGIVGNLPGAFLFMTAPRPARA